MPDDQRVVGEPMGEDMRLRWLLCGVVLIGMAGEACAADMPEFLRGSQTVINASGPVRWDGFYVGGQVGMSVSGADFTNTDPLMTSLLARSLPVRTSATSALGERDSTGSHFGGFIGYNWQFDDTVIGIEANYSRLDKSIGSTSVLTGTALAPDGNVYPFRADGAATVHLSDLANFRVRAGWAAGCFMPYATVGFAVARADVTRTVTVNLLTPAGTPPFAPVTGTEDVKDRFGFGYTGGFGLDYAVMRNLFVRAEYEYDYFSNFEGVNAHIHNVRLGAAFKF
jgi:opacity protein-like surface antigen